MNIRDYIKLVENEAALQYGAVSIVGNGIKIANRVLDLTIQRAVLPSIMALAPGESIRIRDVDGYRWTVHRVSQGESIRFITNTGPGTSDFIDIRPNDLTI